MKIDVEFSAAFVPISGSQHVSIELETNETTVQDILSRLSKQYGQRMTSLLFEKGQEDILSGLMVTVNGKAYTGTALNQQRLPLRDGDRVSLLYFVSGG